MDTSCQKFKYLCVFNTKYVITPIDTVIAHTATFTIGFTSCFIRTPDSPPLATMSLPDMLTCLEDSENNLPCFFLRRSMLSGLWLYDWYISSAC